MTATNRKAELDKENGVIDVEESKKMARLKEYQHLVAKANALMFRDENNQPSEMDFRHVNNILWQFRKDEKQN